MCRPPDQPDRSPKAAAPLRPEMPASHNAANTPLFSVVFAQAHDDPREREPKAA